VLFAEYNWNDSVKRIEEDEVGGTCSTYGKRGTQIYYVESQRERDH
jgi:hypothetical protein